jgi:NADPH:quinone reductase-like Zn-dependent oxidoreductase
MRMKCAVARGGGGLEAIEIREVEVPEPAAGEALVRLTAATLNYRDHLLAMGVLKSQTREPVYVPLSCAAGEVVATGEGVTRVRVGDRVVPTFFQRLENGNQPNSRWLLGGSEDGVARQYAVFGEGGLSRTPDELGDLEAATLPCAGLTAWSALFGPRPLQPGEWVLVQGTGGVSLAALQWAKAAGAHVVLTSSSDAKLHRARAMGADVTINYRTTPEWGAAARAALGGGGVDIVVVVVGTGELTQSADLLNPGGIIAAIGMLDGGFSWDQDVGKPIHTIAVGSRNRHEDMLAFAARHGIRPVVDVVYDLDRLADAFRHLQSGRFFGKVAVNLL